MQKTKIDELKYIGPVFYKRFKKYDLITLYDLKKFLSKNDKRTNKMVLTILLTNPKANMIIQKQVVRPININAWNSVISWGRKNGIKTLPGYKKK